jgi:hypothetical protein
VPYVFQVEKQIEHAATRSSTVAPCISVKQYRIALHVLLKLRQEEHVCVPVEVCSVILALEWETRGHFCMGVDEAYQ